jgi:hypothetical protein
MDVTRLDGGRIVTLTRFLSAIECEGWINRAERQWFHHGPVPISGGTVFAREAVPQASTEMDAATLATTLFERAWPALPATWTERRRTWRLLGLHSRLRLYRYEPMDYFPIHQDDPVQVVEGMQSWLTMLVFLNECSGGSVRFYRDREGQGGPVFEVPPLLGMAVVFPHAAWHDAADVVAGRKYVLRADVLYRVEKP